jgi:glycosyltransferase involved in cell wall biosynthesis
MRLVLFLMARRHRYDVWHVHLANRLAAVSALVGQWLGKPVIVKVAGANEIERGPLATNASPMAKLAYRCLLRAKAWQAISSRIATVLAKKGVPPDRIAAIPNAVDTARFKGIVPRGEGGVRFLFIGRLVPEKNLDTMLSAFAGLLAEHPGVGLKIVGAGPLEATLKQQAIDLGISAQVEFTGHREDIETLVAQADYGVLPSRIEGLSNTLLECMASGLPMIASRVSGNEDLVRTGHNGWLFDPFDRVGLAQCLAEAARLPVEQRRALGAKARETVERHSSLDSVVERLLDLYRRSPVTPSLSSKGT